MNGVDGYKDGEERSADLDDYCESLALDSCLIWTSFMDIDSSWWWLFLRIVDGGLIFTKEKE